MIRGEMLRGREDDGLSASSLPLTSHQKGNLSLPLYTRNSCDILNKKNVL